MTFLLKFNKNHPKGGNGSQNDQETTVYRAIWDKGRRRSEKSLFDEKVTKSAKKWFWSEEVILEQKSDFGAKSDFFSKKSKKVKMGENGSQNDQETTIYRAIWDKWTILVEFY